MTSTTDAYDETVSVLRANGYSRSTGQDRYGKETWARKGCPAISLPVETSATAAERVRVQVAHDVEALASARKPKRFRAQATAALKKAAEEKRLLEIERRVNLRKRELGGIAAVLSTKEINRIIAEIEKEERERHATERLMSSIPGPRADAGRPHARHRS